EALTRAPDGAAPGPPELESPGLAPADVSPAGRAELPAALAPPVPPAAVPSGGAAAAGTSPLPPWPGSPPVAGSGPGAPAAASSGGVPAKPVASSAVSDSTLEPAVNATLAG